MKEEGAVVGLPLYILIAVVVAAVALAAILSFMVTSGPSIDHWIIKIGGKNAKEITCTDIHQDGTAWYNASQYGNLEITVYDQNGHPLPNVEVIIDGCGITQANHTNPQGYAELSLQGVYLHSGQQTDEIKVTLKYPGLIGEQTRSDVISVVRAS